MKIASRPWPRFFNESRSYQLSSTFYKSREKKKIFIKEKNQKNFNKSLKATFLEEGDQEEKKVKKSIRLFLSLNDAISAFCVFNQKGNDSLDFCSGAL